MNKSELAAAVALSSGLTVSDSTKAVDAVFAAISDSLKNGEEVRLVGFGSFSVAEREARQGKNPRTGETIEIPAAKAVKFKAGTQLKDAVNE